VMLARSACGEVDEHLIITFSLSSATVRLPGLVSLSSMATPSSP